MGVQTDEGAARDPACAVPRYESKQFLTHQRYPQKGIVFMEQHIHKLTNEKYSERNHSFVARPLSVLPYWFSISPNLPTHPRITLPF